MIKFKVTSAELARALDVISAAAGEEDKAVPVNNQIKMVADEHRSGKILMKARGSLCTMSLPVTAEFDEPFESCIEYLQLVNLMRMLDGDIEFEIKAGWAHFKSGRARFKVPAFDPALFPSTGPSIGEIFDYMAVPSDIFVRMLQSAYIAVAKQDTGVFNLRGIKLMYAGGKLTVAGCDGHEACRAVSTVSGSKCQVFDAVLPQLAVPALIKLAKRCDNVLIRPGPLMEFVMGDADARFKLHAGQFPDVGKLIPDHQGFEVEVDSGELQSLLKRAALFTDSMIPTKIVNFVWGPDSLRILSWSQKTGVFNDEMPINGRAVGIKEPIVMAVSSTQLLAALGAFSEERAVFSFETGVSQVKVAPVGCPFQLDYVTMPHRAWDISGIDLTNNTDWETT